MIDKDLFKLIKGNRHLIALSVICSIFSLLFNVLITASMVGAIYLTVLIVTQTGYESYYIYYLYFAITIIVSIVIKYLLKRLNERIKNKLGEKVKFELREKLYQKIISIGLKEENGLTSSELTQLAIEGIEQLDLYYSTYITQFFYSLFAPIILFSIVVFIDWKAALVLLAAIPFIPLSIVAVSKYAKKIFSKYWGKYISLGNSFLDALRGLKELKIYNADKEHSKKLDDSNEEFRVVTMKVLIMQLVSITIMDLVAYLGSGIGISLAIYDIYSAYTSGTFELSMCFSALFIVLIAVEFFLPLRALGSAFHVAMNGLSAGKKIFSLFNEEGYPSGDKNIEEFNIKMVNASIGYKEKDIVTNVNLEFKKGVYAIAGHSGSGKSTITKAIVKAASLKGGELYFGKINSKEISKESLYHNLGLINLKSYLFNMSIRDNFKMAKLDIKDEEIISIMKKFKLEKFASNLDEIIYEDSQNISGGEKQRLLFAISLTSNKNIYIFDEATSNIDSDSEQIIMDNIYELSKKKTIILITHRLKNLVNANHIYYLSEGKVKEEGTHLNLMELKGEYAKTFNYQKELEEGYLNV